MADSGSPPRPTLRAGRYVVLASLGEGSQGTTWDAVDKREGLPVAIKHFDVRGARAWKDVELAEREARVLAVLSHPSLPRYVEHFEENGELYLVMEKIEGTPLSKLRKQGPMAEADVVRLLRDADLVLAYLHSREPAVVHRDLKPSNVIRRPDGSFAFVDFGAVRDRLRPEGGSTVVGTFGYMAPEQFQGRAGPGSDVYAIGATALAMLTGEEPEKLPHRGLAIDVEAALAGRASAPLRAALTRMLEPDPDRRPTRIAALLEGIDAAGRRGSAPPRETGRRGRTPPPDWTGVANLGREIGRGIREQVEREIQASVERASRHDGVRRAERRARKREQRQQRASQRRDDRNRGAPWLVMLVVMLALTMAQVAVAIALHVIVPIVLIVLSLFFGRGLREAARSVSEAGNRAGAAIGRARSVVQGRPPDAADGVGSAAGPRVDVGTPERVRVEDAGAAHDAAREDDDGYDDDAHDAHPRAAPPRQRR
jgi:serine/threonine protein kinase